MPKFAACLLLATLFAAVPCAAEVDEWRNSCPLVCEDYDGLVITHQYSTSEYDTSTYWVRKVYFVRKARIIADRHLSDGMQVSVDGDRFVLTWFDFGCHRRVTARFIIEAVVEADIEGDTNGQAWFAQGRRMTDLVPPPDPDEPPAPPAAPGGAP